MDIMDDHLEDDLREMEPGEMTVSLDNGLVLPITLMMDKDGNPTDLTIDCHTILAGSAKQGWYEIDVREGSWSTVTWH